jgi:hypothetical protein
MGPRSIADKVNAFKHSCACPIGQDVMEDPVIAADGFTYDRKNIETWINQKETVGRPATSPMTGEILACQSKVETSGF